ncbi:MAG: hypothetical protein BWX73_02716 [Lentisphaerae bacterium ADurb.Bin082]|nr:MAG: hypothetical protein BWX73_02716 [Lentisphaerae bacterium ADurb.Bin082]
MKTLYWTLLLAVSVVYAQPIQWSHGVWDQDGPPTGKLLSENNGYWGDCALTGVEYRYLSQPTNPPDRLRSDSNTFGRRLLDGRFSGDWHVPVGQNRGPLLVLFDFKRPCLFTEVDLYAFRSNPHHFTLEVADDPDNGPWRKVYDKPLDKKDSSVFYRAKMPADSRGRYLKLSFNGQGTTCLDEVIVWGDAEVSDVCPEQIRPVHVPDLAADQRYSLPGIASSAYSLDDFAAWQKTLGVHQALPVLWAAADTSQPTAPVLPAVGIINAPLAMPLAQNEIESCYLTLTNPADHAVRVTLSADGPSGTGLQLTLLGGGVLPANRPKRPLTNEEQLRLFVTGDLPPDAEPEGDMQVLPFFAPGQQLGRSQMKRYLANAEALIDFPTVVLPPGGSLVVMLRVSSVEAIPGTYTAQLRAASDDGRLSVMPLGLSVVSLSLPWPDIWLRAWGVGTQQFPFESLERVQNDVETVRKLGATVWDGFPEPGSKAEFFAKTGPCHHHLMIRPRKYIYLGYGGKLKVEDLTEQDRLEIAEESRRLAAEAKGLGLGYDKWFMELWDEPGEGNSRLYGELARIIKGADPAIRIYMNPLFWRPGFPPQEVIFDHLKDFYNELIDISVPITNLVGDNLTTQELWSKPRMVQAHYLHPARRAGRGMSWKSFRHGFNGWGYYCYYAPQGNAWDIKTWTSLGYSYQMVFPGPKGAIITPIYETMREGWEDYRLLCALRAAGKQQLLDELLTASGQNQVNWQDLRNRALAAFK